MYVEHTNVKFGFVILDTELKIKGVFLSILHVQQICKKTLSVWAWLKTALKLAIYAWVNYNRISSLVTVVSHGQD